MYGYVYKITNLLNGKCYVGQKKSSCFDETYWGSGSGIKAAINKYGKQNFKREILCECETQEELDNKELDNIISQNALSPNGYNLTLNVFQSGYRNCHSPEVRAKISKTRKNWSDEKREEVRQKVEETVKNRTPERKAEIRQHIQEALKNSEKFHASVTSEEYRNKQREIANDVWKNEDLRKLTSEKSKENWKNEEYRTKCIKNLCLEDSKVQFNRSIIGNLKNSKNNKSNLIERNKSEKAREISKKNAEKMREKLKNMTQEEKAIVKKKSRATVLLHKSKGEITPEIETLFNEIKAFEPTYDLYDSAKDRLLNKNFPEIKMIKKEVITLPEEVPVYDLTVDGDIPNFQLATQTYVHNCPGGGKSRTMAYLAKHSLEQMKKVIFITLELSEAETMANINTAVTGITLHEMLNPLYRQQFIDDVTKFKDRHCSDLVVKFFKPGTVTCDTIHNYIQKVIQYKREKLGRDWKPDVIILDYMDKLLPTQKVKGNMYEDIGGVANDAKNLAITFDCPVITGSQLGRYVWNLSGDQVVSMDSISDSSQKVHLAHSMTTLNMNKGEKAAGKIRLYLAKSRSGIPNSVVWCDWNIGRCQLTESEPWDPKALDDANDKFTIKSSDSRK